MGERADIAVNGFAGGLNCAQAVAAAFCEDNGLPRDMAIRAVCGFGGGCRSGELCGAIAGGVFIVGLRHGGEGEKKLACNKKTIEYMDRIRAAGEPVTCRDLLGCDTSTPEGMAEAQAEGLFKTVCPAIVWRASEALEDLGY